MVRRNGRQRGRCAHMAQLPCLKKVMKLMVGCPPVQGLRFPSQGRIGCGYWVMVEAGGEAARPFQGWSMLICLAHG